MRPLSPDEFRVLGLLAEPGVAEVLDAREGGRATADVCLDLDRLGLAVCTVLGPSPVAPGCALVSFDVTARGRHALDIHRAFLAAQGGRAR